MKGWAFVVGVFVAVSMLVGVGLIIGWDIGRDERDGLRRQLEWSVDSEARCRDLLSTEVTLGKSRAARAESAELLLASCKKVKDYCCWMEQTYLDAVENLECCDEKYGCWKPLKKPVKP